MKRIGLLSDTHGNLDDTVFKYFKECDEIWHAGDIGHIDVANKLSSFKPLKAVYGNIDGTEIRSSYTKFLIFTCEEVKIVLTHIGGTPGKYEPSSRKIIQDLHPKLFICGHSHILRVKYDQKYNLLYMNPGAAGNQGFHKVKTLIRFTINKLEIKDLEVIEYPRNQNYP
ncbi:MAG: metallophosphoesterase family protein [bacterium]